MRMQRGLFIRPRCAAKPMKRYLCLFVLLVTAQTAFCETIKLKSGVIINGSITGQTEYVLNVQTSYGPISLNQREVESISPDKHRVLLKGGGEFIGTVTDLDEFNLSLQTDEGIVNIDVSQIASMDVYDYDEGEKQKKYVEKKIELEQAATAAASSQTAQSGLSEAEIAAGAGAGLNAGGLSFDSDLEKVFPSKPVVIEQKPQEITILHDHNEPAQPVFEEDKPQLTEKEKEMQKDEDALTIDQMKKIKTSKNYFALQGGVLTSNLKIDLSKYGGKEESLSGANMAFGAAYMRRFSKYLFWGGEFSFGLLPKGAFAPSDTLKVETSGQIYNLSLLSNFYVNPDSRYRVYLTGGFGYSSLSLDKNIGYYDAYGKLTDVKTEGVSSSNINGIFGAGFEWSIQDINLGIEVRANYSPLKEDLKESSALRVMTTAKLSWFF